MKKKSNKLLFILIIASTIIILFLAAQIQQKDKIVQSLTQQINNLKSKNTDGITSDAEDEIRKIISDNLTNIINEKPSLGCKWYLDEIKFIKKDLVYIEYEDGHTLSNLMLKITNPGDYKTWVKTYDLKK